MRDKRTDDEPTGEDRDDWAVLSTLLSEGDQWPWSVADLVSSLDRDDVLIIDSVNRLERGGLIHRTSDDLVYPTRTAIYFERIYEEI